MSSYYNEFDPYAAQWLRNLIAAGHIADGVVDSRSILEVTPEDLNEFTQCHFFAGIGVWSHALHLAQWPDTRPVWTGSCPCQPFSVAGRSGGVHDERHLWPHWFWLIEQCRPAVVFGEQVEAAVRHGWLDLVQSDLEGIGYAVGCVAVPAGGVGAPHIRQRLWFVADSEHDGRDRQGGASPFAACNQPNQRIPNGNSASGVLADTEREQCGPRGVLGHSKTVQPHGTEQTGQSAGDGGVDGLAHPNITQPGQPGRPECTGIAGVQSGADVNGRRAPCGMGHPDGERTGRVPHAICETQAGESGRGCGNDAIAPGPASRPDAANSHWRAADWLLCRDGKWRPVEPGTFPLAHGAPARVGRLRAYGNAIAPQVAAQVIQAFMECRP